MPRRNEIVLEVWRETCRHLELPDSIERIARLLAHHTAADHVAVRGIDLARRAIETIAVAACRPDLPPLTLPRSTCSAGALSAVVAWASNFSVRSGRLPAVDDDGLMSLVVPGFHGDYVAVPVRAGEGPTGILLFLAPTGAFSDADRVLASTISEPFGVALSNSVRVQELKRLCEALEADREALLSRLGRQDVSDAVVGEETGLRQVMDQVTRVAGTDVPVLIFGETGSGKEVLARAVHARSPRARGPFVRINCAAYSAGLIESELFGHETGSFTGATVTRPGAVERADGGTLFLDEIHEMPLEAQARLLHVLEGTAVERVGGRKPLPVNVRLVAATHFNLETMVEGGSFLEGLWRRLSAFPIHLPPLRERREDIPRLASHFAWRAGLRLGGVPLVPTAADLELLLAYDWPGNLRELGAVMERAAILGNGRTLHVAAALGTSSREPAAPATNVSASPADVTMDAAMRRHIELALQQAGGRIEGPGGAAVRLAINPHTLRGRMRRLGVDWNRFRGSAPMPAFGAPLPVLDDAMAAHVRRVLELTRGRVEGRHGAAVRLRVNPHTLRARMRKLGIDPAAFRRK